ncbi:UDP-N-acetylglucosamine 1-carboxyvinyltransferase [Sporanaerobium hydrogeniformans]|uniref:UDP-N-acetylglucosamine 1-carboxyvinyltransferase n=1 Tax=Sporanaerobium hydrogeniformans TaxID=3072179 RepID=A0AC61DBK6_9FIRM|nr:UDP-N-acetylglucosamine 1-carboxyvinyltransferase [Sporanaerobium hydrogeniformans]PHV70198.1 UDP-N-acetylglucosamine 1-carboxyvinyltransferase [Sporanaerobium hydrogeniformans]
MSELCIRGGNRLVGEVTINGAKNAAVAILPAALLVDGECEIENLPYIDDVVKIKDAMEDLGAITSFMDNHTLKVDASTLYSHEATKEYIGNIRASYYLLGALLGRFKKAEVCMPGGCNFGVRPIDQHIKGFEALGAKVIIENGIIKAYAGRLVGTKIYLDVVSVGATINIMLAAVLAEGTTIIENAAKEPHVVDVANFLNMMGAEVKGAGTDVIRIKGVERLMGGKYATIPDQIEAGTYMMAAAMTGGDVYVRNIIPEHMYSVSLKMIEMGIHIEEGDDYVRVVAPRELKATNVKTLPHPGFPTDLQPQMVALLSIAQGTSTVIEGVWDNRFQYIDQLKRIGAHIKVDGRMAVVEGEAKLTGAKVTATDLRAGAALVIAALRAKGETTIKNVKYIDRGYEAIEEKLTALGAQIKRRADK